jgi:hypothetical protein
MKYTINELANSKGVSPIVREALLQMEAELKATNRQVEILSDALAESRREVAQLKAQRQWVGLTDDEILKLAYPIRWQEVDDFEADKAVNFAQAIEAKLKEKNT